MQKLWVPAAIALVLVAAGAWWYMHHQESPLPAPAPVKAAEKPPDAPLPPTGDTDARVRKAVGALSTRSELQQWLSDSDLLDRWVVIATNLAEDVTPRKQLASLAPARRFAEKGGRVDPQSYARYDVFADVISSVDAKGFAVVVHDLHPLLETAYHRLGYPDRSVDELARSALQRLIDAPVVEREPALEPKGALYRYSDEKLESLGAVEKHLLRMGPRNTRLIQSKAREIAAALDLKLASH